MITKSFISVVVLILAVTGIASADHFLDHGNHLWTDNANWLDGSVPTAADTVYFVGWMGSPEVCNVGAGESAVAGTTYLGWATTEPVITLNIAGTMTTGVMSTAVTDDLVTGNVNVTGNGILNVTGNLTVGQGGTSTFSIKDNGYVSAATLYLTMWNPGSTGHIQIDGGMLDIAGQFWMGTEGTGINASMDISGGKLKVANAWRSTIEDYIARGKITGNGLVGLNNFLITSDNTSTIFQIPEPMTMTLLCVGGLLLRRKK